MRHFAAIFLFSVGAIAAPNPAEAVKPRLEWEWSELDEPLDGEPASVVFAFKGVSAAVPGSVVFSPDGKFVAAGCGDRIVVWSVETKKRVTRMSLPSTQEAIKLTFSLDGKELISHGSDDFTFRVWDTKTGKQLRELTRKVPMKRDPNRTPVWALSAFAPGGGVAAEVRSFPKTGVALIDTATGTETMVASEPRIDAVELTQAVFSPDGKSFTFKGPDARLRLFETSTGNLLRAFPTVRKGSHTYAYVRYSPDGSLLLAADYYQQYPQKETTYSIWKVSDGTRCLTQTGMHGLFGPGNRFVVADSQGVFDLVANEFVSIGNASVKDRQLVGASADGSVLAFLGPPLGERSNPRSSKRAIYLTPAPILLPPVKPGDFLSDEALAKMWSGFISDNTICREHCTAVLTAKPGLVEEAAGKNFKPVSAAEAERVAALIRDLRDPSPAVAKRAQDQMWAVRVQFAKAIAEAEAEAPEGPERYKITTIRIAYGGPQAFADQARRDADLRGIATLEKLGTPAAKEVLKAVAAGAPSATRTSDAAAALARFKLAQ